MEFFGYKIITDEDVMDTVDGNEFRRRIENYYKENDPDRLVERIKRTFKEPHKVEKMIRKCGYNECRVEFYNLLIQEYTEAFNNHFIKKFREHLKNEGIDETDLRGIS